MAGWEAPGRGDYGGFLGNRKINSFTGDKKKILVSARSGSVGKLSFEHVPPRAAFNDRPVLVAADINQIIEKFDCDFTNIKTKKHQRGAGAFSLCEKCNNDTGSWYGNSFADWAFQAYKILKYTEGEPSLYYQFSIFPLRVIKQIICMFFSANGPKFHDAHPDLVKFVLNKDDKYIKQEIRIYTYFSLGGISRQSGIAGLLNLNKRCHHLFSEIGFFPLGYVMTIESEVPDNRPVDISFFANYSYNDFKEISLRIPVLPLSTYFPGDYRTREDVMKDVAKNLLEEQIRNK